MNKSNVACLCGLLLMVLAVLLLVPLLVAVLYESEEEIPAFGWSIAITFGVGALLYLPFRHRPRDLGVREGFAIVALGWSFLSLFGALPFWLASNGIPTYLDAFFETLSGFTTTGASILANPEELPRGLLLWRSAIQWLGGMGIVVLTVAILPFLGAGGYQMLRAEVPGPTADKLAPRIAETAKILWRVYLILTVVQILLLLPKMDAFDATCHAFCTLATGGFSTLQRSIDGFESVYVDVVITVFMLIAGANFVLHYRLLFGLGGGHFKDAEFRFYVGVIVVATLIITLILFFGYYPEQELHPEKYDSLGQCLRYSSFQVASVVTTTGYVTADYDRWPNACRFILVILMVVGGCAGSTGGGVKWVRLMVVMKYGVREIQRLLRPRAVIPVKVGGHSVSQEVVGRVLGFLALYVLVLCLAVLLMNVILMNSETPEDSLPDDDTFVTAFGAVVSAFGNIGPGLAQVGPMENFAAIPAAGKVLLLFCMLLGRLEIYSVLVLFSPHLWRR